MNSSNWNKLEKGKAKAVLEYFGFIHAEVCNVVEDLCGPCIEVNTAVDHHCHLLVNKPYNCILDLFLKQSYIVQL